MIVTFYALTNIQNGCLLCNSCTFVVMLILYTKKKFKKDDKLRLDYKNIDIFSYVIKEKILYCQIHLAYVSVNGNLFSVSAVCCLKKQKVTIVLVRVFR